MADYMFVFHRKNAGQNRNIQMDNKSLENVAKFRYLRTIVTSKNYIHEEMTELGESLLPFAPVQNLFSYRYVSKNLKIKINKIVIFYIFYSSKLCLINMQQRYNTSHRLK
jgi:hypothetical protein